MDDGEGILYGIQQASKGTKQIANLLQDEDRADSTKLDCAFDPMTHLHVLLTLSCRLALLYFAMADVHGKFHLTQGRTCASHTSCCIGLVPNQGRL